MYILSIKINLVSLTQEGLTNPKKLISTLLFIFLEFIPTIQSLTTTEVQRIWKCTLLRSKTHVNSIQILSYRAVNTYFVLLEETRSFKFRIVKKICTCSEIHRKQKYARWAERVNYKRSNLVVNIVTTES